MSKCVNIFVEIPFDSEIYKKAVEFSNSNKDLSMFNTPEKVLFNCLNYGYKFHILDSMDILASQADAYRKKHNDI